MRIIGKIFGGLLLLIILGLGALYVAFWARPIGVNNYINKVSFEMLLSSPEFLTQLGFIDNTPFDFHSGKLDDYTKAQDEKSLEQLRKARAGLDRYGPEGLEGQELLSWEITAWFFDDLLRQAEYEYNGYRVSQLSGVAVNMPQFLTDAHAITNEKSAERYISRLNEFGRVLSEVKVRLEDDAANGVIPPDFVIEKSLIGMRAFIEGGAEASPLITTMSERMADTEISEEQQAEFLAEATSAVSEKVIPGYNSMIALLEEQLTQTDHDAGIWRIPNGDEIYALSLKSSTTTDMTADEIHNLGKSEVERISKEMDAILISQGLIEGTVTERVQSLMSDPQYLFDNTDAGRTEMIEYLNGLNDVLMAKAGDYFITLPPQPLEVVRVPEYSQDSAPGGYYNSPALDGSRPGRFYINQKNTHDNPRWTLPTLMYHEAAPGHHFQIASAQLIEGVPELRKMGIFGAYTEGWALYAERIAKTDMGMYDEDPLGDLGRLQAEMFRAVRLVVDTGMHSKRWSREQAIEYMIANTGNTEAEVTREIERYAVWPGQATSYKTGQLAILKIRAHAEAELGEDFDIREFHEVILSNGAMPLGILEESINDWIAEQKNG